VIFLYKVRIRGIYATALTKLAIDAGLIPVMVTKPIVERFKIESRYKEAPDATIKTSNEDSDELVIIGFPEAVDYILNNVISKIPSIIIRRAKLGLYAVFKTKVIRREGRNCIVLYTDNNEAILRNSEKCIENEELVVHVLKPLVKQGEKPIVGLGPRVLGHLVVLGKGNYVTFSEHIRSTEKRALLYSASQSYVRQGISIKWRSAAETVPIEVALEELENLSKKLVEIEERAKSAQLLEVVYPGEALTLVRFSRISKEYLDNVRNSVIPTAPLHHSIKSCNAIPQEVADLVDMIISEGADRGAIKKALIKYIIKIFSTKPRIFIKHFKPTGECFNLGPAYIDSIKIHNLDVEIVLRRVIRGEGMYDGLGVSKEPGDTAITTIKTNDWLVIHKYYSQSGEIKGIYININTPPEVRPDGVISYIDLFVDIVAKPNAEPQVIDFDEFKSACEESIISNDICEKIYAEIDRAKEIAKTLISQM